MSRKFSFKRTLYFAWAILQASSLAVCSTNVASAEQSRQLKAPSFRPSTSSRARDAYQDDILLVMPAMKTDLGMTAIEKAAKEKLIKDLTAKGEPVEHLLKDEVADALKEAHGKVIRSFGEGEDLVLVVQTEKGKLTETEAKLSKDKKHFTGLQRNYQATLPAVTTTVPANDPYFPNQWYLKLMQVPDSWKESRNGAGIVVADIDGGGGPAIMAELAGRVLPGFDPEANPKTTIREPLPVRANHPSVVCSGAFATTNNGLGIASPAYRSYIFPMDECPHADPLHPSEELILRDLYYLKQNARTLGVKIINIEAQVSSAENSFFNPVKHPTMHKYLKDLYSMGLITVVPMGNYGFYDPNPRVYYMIGVSGIDSSLRLFNYGWAGAISSCGNPVWFTAAGKDVLAVDKTGMMTVTGGTSLAAPLIASQIAQVWSEYPQMTNTQVLQIMVASCAPIDSSLMGYYGYGIPSSLVAVKKALIAKSVLPWLQK